jgi:hypothetical protein
MTFITHGFRVSVISNIRERVRDLTSPLRFMLRRSSLVECVSVLHETVLQCAEKKYIHQYVKPCEENPKGDVKSRTLSRMFDITETRNPCVIKVILLACPTCIDIFKFY